jgi:hypothetical protein
MNAATPRSMQLLYLQETETMQYVQKHCATASLDVDVHHIQYA